MNDEISSVQTFLFLAFFRTIRVVCSLCSWRQERSAQRIIKNRRTARNARLSLCAGRRQPVPTIKSLAIIRTRRVLTILYRLRPSPLLLRLRSPCSPSLPSSSSLPRSGFSWCRWCIPDHGRRSRFVSNGEIYDRRADQYSNVTQKRRLFGDSIKEIDYWENEHP